jgi:hypothetical protein
VFSVFCVFTSCCLVTASSAIDPSTFVFTASCPRWLSPISLQLLSWINWLPISKLPGRQPSHTNLQLFSLPSYDSSSNGSWPSLYSLGTGHTENTSPNSSSIVARTSVVAITWQQLLYSCLFHGHCLAASLHATFSQMQLILYMLWKQWGNEFCWIIILQIYTLKAIKACALVI